MDKITQEEKFEFCKNCYYIKETTDRITICDKENKLINWFLGHDNEHCPEGNW